MKVKDAIKQLNKMDQEAELVIEFDEFPNQFSPVLGFDKDMAGETSRDFMNCDVLERYYEDDRELKNVRNIVICAGYEP